MTLSNSSLGKEFYYDIGFGHAPTSIKSELKHAREALVYNIVLNNLTGKP